MNFCFVLFILINIIILSINKKLIFVELQSRHGARAPLELNENSEDIIGEQWSNFGELTGVGQRMEYLLGLRNRHRYITNDDPFLSNKYDPHELLVYSTSLNRTLLSMTSQLQGLYPISQKSGEELNEEQLKKSKPPLDIKYDEITEELSRIKNNSLPDFMTIVPIHMINPSQKKMNNFDYIDCKPNVEKLTKKNIEEKQSIKNIIKDFKDKYSQNLTENNILPEDFEYNIDNIGKICDAILVDTTEGKEMKDFFDKTKFDKTLLIEKCKEVLKINFRDKLYGDNEMNIILLEESTLLREMIHYMKKRVDADIEGEIKNVSDYSKPKMVIISGHDATLSAQIIFILKIFKLDLDSYQLPTYSAQTAFEVTREDNNDNKKLKYSDYKVTFYFNDKVLLDISMDKFIKTVENNIWTKNQIDKFCYGDILNSDDNLMIILVVISAFTLFLLIIIIILAVCIVKKNKKDDDVNSMDSDKLINEE